MPDEGSQRNLTENSRISSKPSQNTGIDRPIMAKIMVIVSNTEYCLMADIIPHGRPMITAMIIAKPDSLIVAGKAAISSFMTGVLEE